MFNQGGLQSLDQYRDQALCEREGFTERSNPERRRRLRHPPRYGINAREGTLTVAPGCNTMRYVLRKVHSYTI